VRLGKVSGERPREGGDLTRGCRNRRDTPTGAADSDVRFEQAGGALSREKEGERRGGRGGLIGGQTWRGG
jgi:hypothetical protein